MPGFMDYLTQPLVISELWNDLKNSKWVLLTCGMASSVIGFYIGCRLHPLDTLSQVCIIFALVLGFIGTFIVMYLLALFVLAEIIYRGQSNRPTTADRSLRQLNDVDYLQNDPPPPYELVADPSQGLH